MPPATGKLSIWAANTNAAVTPSSGTRRSSRSRLARRSPYADGADAGTAQTAATSGARKPSGMCMVITAGQTPTIGKWMKRGS